MKEKGVPNCHLALETIIPRYIKQFFRYLHFILDVTDILYNTAILDIRYKID